VPEVAVGDPESELLPVEPDVDFCTVALCESEFVSPEFEPVFVSPEFEPVFVSPEFEPVFELPEFESPFEPPELEPPVVVVPGVPLVTIA